MPGLVVGPGLAFKAPPNPADVTDDEGITVVPLRKRTPSKLESGARRSDPIRILHLSDFHFREARAWDIDPVINGLTEEVARMAETGLAPDLIAITGDIAQAGKESEYALAEAWITDCLLPATGVTNRRVLLVPGNHDVDRSQVGFSARALQKDLLSSQGQDDIASVLGSASERVPLLARLQPWLRFASRFGPTESTVHEPWWGAKYHINGWTIRIAAFCTSFMAHGDNDKSRLLLGRWQANKLLEGRDSRDVTVGLMHHPWDYLADFDVLDVRPLVEQRCDLVLRGHMHRPDASVRSDPGNQVIEVECGACYESGRHPNAFNLVELDLAQQKATVHLRTWDGASWIPDRNRFGGRAAEAKVELPMAAPPPRPARP